MKSDFMETHQKAHSSVTISPVVTIGMPIFNAGSYLRKAVLSIIDQSFASWELMIIDDASTDGAVDSICDLRDPRIRIIEGKVNRGLAARLNEAICLASGKYFARMDQDDISHPERFAMQVAFLESNPRVDLVGTKCITIDECGVINGCLPLAIEHEAICRHPWSGFYLPHPTWMGKLEWFQKHRYASPGPYFCEDQELLLRTYKESHFHVLPQALLAYRIQIRKRWIKHLRTRMTLFRLQLSYFIKEKRFDFIAFSILVTSIRILHDAVSYCIPMGRLGVDKLKVTPKEDRFLAYWVSNLPGWDNQKKSCVNNDS